MNIAIKPENINTPASLAGKVALVTGSTSGIGWGIARALAAAGADIVLHRFGKPEEVADAQAKIAAARRHLQRHLPGLRLYAAGGSADRRASEGAQYPARGGDP